MLRQLMKQLRENWRSRELGMALTKVSMWVPQIRNGYHTTSRTNRRAARNVKGWEGRGVNVSLVVGGVAEASVRERAALES